MEHQFGLHPWDAGRLSWAEWRYRLDVLEELAYEAEQARRG